MRHKLHRKLLWTFFGITLLAFFLAFAGLIVMFSGIRQNKMNRMEEKIKEQILFIYKDRTIEVEKLCELLSTEEYEVQGWSKEEAAKEYKEYYDRLMQGETIQLNEEKHQKEQMLFLQDDTIFEIRYREGSYRYSFFLIYVALIVVFALLVGSLIIGRITKRLLEPVYDMMHATSKVAEGDFTVQVEEKKSREFGHLIHNFNKMVKELGSIETLRSDFISNVSHEFKTPIASIQGFAKLLQTKGISEEDRKEYSDIIVAESERLTNLSSNILRLSRLENQTLQLTKTSFNLAEQIRRCIMMLENEWEKKEIAFVIELDDMNVIQNEELLQQVWINLLQNAIKFTDRGGEITVTAVRCEHAVRIMVKDTGIGMSEETMAHIFDKFFQGDSARKEEGNGLGLALVKKIIDLSSGTIEVRSKIGEGTTFQVDLPN